MKQKRSADVRALVQGALFAALLCMLSPIAIPAGPVPVTLGIFAVLLTGIVLPWRRALPAVAVYILMGVIGLPVFSGGNAGPGVLLGPTGGYLWSYVPMVLLVSVFGRKGKGRALAASLMALLICYIAGTRQFVWLMDCSWRYALGVCVVPFLAIDLMKAVLAALLGTHIRERLQASELLPVEKDVRRIP